VFDELDVKLAVYPKEKNKTTEIKIKQKRSHRRFPKKTNAK